MRVEQFDPLTDDASVRECFAMVQSGKPEDDPHGPPWSYPLFRIWWAYGFGDDPRQAFLATGDSGDPVGGCLLELPARENTGVAFAYVLVAAPARRGGIGTALLAHAAAQAEKAGRTLLMADARVGAPGFAFATASGARGGLREVRRVLDVDDALAARLPGLRAEAEPHAVDYTLRRWAGPTPPDQVEQVCALYNAMEDAPREATVDSAVFDAERLLAGERHLVDVDMRWYSVAASHRQTGEMAALTQVNVDPRVNGWGFQDLTAVTRSHRGHRLGLLAKVAMLEWLTGLEPGMRQVVTSNAEVNQHMIAVNEQLGYRIMDYFQTFEIDVAAARNLSASPF